MLGFLPQRVGCLSVSCAQIGKHTHAHAHAHTNTQWHTYMLECTHERIHAYVSACRGMQVLTLTPLRVLFPVQQKKHADTHGLRDTDSQKHTRRRVTHTTLTETPSIAFHCLFGVFISKLSVCIHSFTHSGCPWRLPFVKNTLNHTVAKPLSCTNTHSRFHSAKCCTLESPLSFPLQHRGSVARKLKMKLASVCT